MAAKGIQIPISGDTSPLQAAIGRSSSMLGSFGVAAVGGVAAAAVAIGAAGLKIGSDFDAAYDTIRVSTGATGDELAALKQSFKDVVSSVPADFESAATAVSELNKRLGMDGAAVETLAGQFLELSRLTETDLNTNIETLTRTLGDWGIANEDAGASLDTLFRASQATGPSVDRIGELMTRFGAPLRQFGFGFEESAALLGKFEKEGVNTELVLGSMRTGLGRLAKSGEAPAEALARITDEIANAGGASEANKKAIELFGARAGPDMAAAIREGRFELGDLFDTIAGGTDTIMGASADTRDMGESFKLLKNKILVGLEPMMVGLFDGASKAIERILPVVDRIVTVFGESGFAGVVSMLADEFRQAWPAIQEALGNMASSIFGWLQAQVPVWAEQLAEWGKAFVEWIGPRIPPALRELGKLVGKLLEWLLDEGLPKAVAALVKFGKAFVAWVGPMIPPFLLELGKLLLALLNWIATDAAPKLLGKLATWSAQFAVWVTTSAIPGLLRAIAGLGTALFNWFIGPGKTAIINGLVIAGIAMMGWFLALPSKVIGWIGSLLSAMYNFGRDIIQGLWNGMKDKAEDVKNWIAGLASDIASTFAGVLGIGSPSKVFKEMGTDTVGGFNKGIESAPRRWRPTRTVERDQSRSSGAPMVTQVFLDSRMIAEAVADANLASGGGYR